MSKGSGFPKMTSDYQKRLNKNQSENKQHLYRIVVYVVVYIVIQHIYEITLLPSLQVRNSCCCELFLVMGDFFLKQFLLSVKRQLKKLANHIILNMTIIKENILLFFFFLVCFTILPFSVKRHEKIR